MFSFKVPSFSTPSCNFWRRSEMVILESDEFMTNRLFRNYDPPLGSGQTMNGRMVFSVKTIRVEEGFISSTISSTPLTYGLTGWTAVEPSWFSFSSGWFLCCMLIFQGVLQMFKICKSTTSHRKEILVKIRKLQKGLLISPPASAMGSHFQLVLSMRSSRYGQI